MVLSVVQNMRSVVNRIVCLSVCRSTQPGMRTSKSELRQFLAAFSASLSIFCSGAAFAWITPLLVRLVEDERSEIPLTPDQSSWVVSFIEVGNLFTPLPAGFLVDRMGRKPILLACGPVYLATWILVLTIRSVAVLYVMRIVQGLAMGFVFTVLPMYLGEIAGPKIRGSLSLFFQGMWYLGILYVVSIGPYVSYQVITWFCLAPCLVFLAIFVWFPESPYFLVMRGRYKEAETSLAWLRGEDDAKDVERELQQIRESVEEEARNRATWKDVLGTRVGRKSLMITSMIAATEVLSGVSAIMIYASQTFSKTEGGILTADVSTIILALSPFMVTLLAGGLVDRLGRRPILLISSSCSTVCLIVAAVYYIVHEMYSTHYSQMFSWVPTVAIILYITLISFGTGPLVPTLQSELFPNSTRGIASGIVTLILTITSFIVLKLYQVIQDGVGLYLNYCIFSFFCALGTIGIYFFVPETKGKTFAEIQKMLQ